MLFLSTPDGLGVMEGHTDAYPNVVEVDSLLAVNRCAIHNQLEHVTRTSSDRACEFTRVTVRLSIFLSIESWAMQSSNDTPK